MLEFKISQISEKGKQREVNQDCKFVNEYGNLIIIADGVGDCEDGKLASQLAVESVKSTVLPVAENVQRCGKIDEDDIYKALFEAVNKANEELRNNKKYLATTIDIVLIDPVNKRGYVAHLGDSSVYLFNETDGLAKLTEDDSKKKNGSGVVVPEGMTKLFARGLKLEKYLGMKSEEGEKIVPSYHPFDIKLGDVILAATDGLTDLVSADEISSILVHFDEEGYDVTKELANRANDPKDILGLYAQEKGVSEDRAKADISGKDNITVIAVKAYNKNYSRRE